MNTLTVTRVGDKWRVDEVQSPFDRPRVGAMLGDQDLWVINQCNTYRITRRELGDPPPAAMIAPEPVAAPPVTSKPATLQRSLF